MISRKERNYTKKSRKLVTFGQFVLPLTVIMALALLFFSVKLFFRDPVIDTGSSVVVQSQNSGLEVSSDGGAEVSPNTNAQEPKVSAPVAAKTAKPAKRSQKKHVKTTAVKPASQATAKTVKTQPVRKAQAALPTEDDSARKKRAEPVRIKQNTIQKRTDKDKKVQTVAETPKPETTKKAVLTGQSVPKSRTPKETAAKTDSSSGRWDVQIGGFAAHDNAAQLADKARSDGYAVYMLEGTKDGAPFWRVRVKGASGKAESEKLSGEIAAKGYPVYLINIK